MANYLVLGDINSWITNVGGWILGAVALAVGFGLIISGIMVFGKALGGTSQEWGKAVIGFVVMVFGGLIGWWGFQGILSFAKTHGKEIPHS